MIYPFKLPVRMETNNPYYLDFTVVDANGEVLRVPREYKSYKAADIERDISVSIVEALNAHYQEPVDTEEVAPNVYAVVAAGADNFCEPAPVAAAPRKRGWWLNKKK